MLELQSTRMLPAPWGKSCQVSCSTKAELQGAKLSLHCAVVHQDCRLIWGQEANLAGVGETSVAHHSKLGQQWGAAKNSTRNTECPAALLQLGLTWPDQLSLLAWEWKWEQGLRLSHNTNNTQLLSIISILKKTQTNQIREHVCSGGRHHICSSVRCCVVPLTLLATSYFLWWKISSFKAIYKGAGFKPELETQYIFPILF